jgi:transposase-like protein
MPKPYSQDLRDRVIDAVERGEMSRRAAARRYEISESAAIKWLERVERDGSREPGTRRPSRLQADAAPGLSGGDTADEEPADQAKSQRADCEFRPLTKPEG